MDFWRTFYMAAMPIAKVFITCGVGAYLGHPKRNILTPDARKLLNKLVVVAFTPAFVFANLAKSLSFQNILKWWYMPLNIILCFTCGLGLGILLLKYTNVPAHLRNLTIVCCAAGNTGNVPLVLVPTICEEQEGILGDPQTCARDAIAYVSYGMWMGIALMWTIGYKLLQPPNFQHKESLPGFGGSSPSSSPKPTPNDALGSDGAPVSSATPIPLVPAARSQDSETPRSGAYSRTDFGDFQGAGNVAREDPRSQAGLAIQGAGNVAREDSRSQARMTIQGAGSVAREDPRSQARMTIQGAGNVAREDPRSQARMTIQGAGNVAREDPRSHARMTIQGAENVARKDLRSQARTTIQGAENVAREDLRSQARPVMSIGTGGGSTAVSKPSDSRGASSLPSLHQGVVGLSSAPGPGSQSGIGSPSACPPSTPSSVKRIATGNSVPPTLDPQRALSSLKTLSPDHEMVGINLSSSPTSSSGSAPSAAAAASFLGNIRRPDLTQDPIAYLRFIAHKYDLTKMLNPPTCAAILGLLVGGIPPFKSLMGGPFLVFLESASLIGQAMVPTMNMVLGASMVQEGGVSELETPAVVGIISVRLVLLPIIGMISISFAKSVGMLPLDPLFKFVLLVQFTMPTAINVGTLSQLFCVGEKESAIVLFYAYLSATFFITFWIMIYLEWLL